MGRRVIPCCHGDFCGQYHGAYIENDRIAWLCLDSKGYGNRDPHRMHFIYELVEYVGRWSMIDVFVITILASLVQMGQLMNIVPAMGIIFFGVVVILTMFAAMTFDPRLTWDRCERKKCSKYC